MLSNWWCNAMQWWSNLVYFSGPLITSCASDSANHQIFLHLAVFVLYVFVFWFLMIFVFEHIILRLGQPSEQERVFFIPLWFPLSTWHLSVQKVFTFAHFFCLPGRKFPACCRKLVAVPIKRDHLGHEWGWVATEIAFHENFATKMNSSINKQSAFKDWYRAKLFGTIALASSPPLRLKSAT